MTREHGLALLLIGALVFVWFGQSGKSDALRAADLAAAERDSIAEEFESAVAATLDVTDSLEAAGAAITALRAEADTRVARANERARTASDRLVGVSTRLEEHLAGDTVGLRLDSEKDALHAESLAAKDTIIVAVTSERDAALLWGQGWMDNALAKDSLLVDALQVIDMGTAIEDGLRDHISRKNRQKWYERTAAVAAVVATVLIR